MNTFQRQLTNLRQQQQLLYILLFSFATILIWVTLGLVTSQKKTEISAELQKLAKPLSPTINRQVLLQLSQERVFDQTQLNSFPIYKLVVSKEGVEQMVTTDTPSSEITNPSPIVRPSPSATPEANLIPNPVVASPTPAATTSGSI